LRISAGKLYSFIEMPAFVQQLEQKASPDLLFRIEDQLLKDPERGMLIPGAHGARKGREQYISDAQFADLMESANEALAYVRGLPNNCRVTVRSAPVVPKLRGKKEIVQLRRRLRFSQTMLARVLNVSPVTVRAWEAGRRRPSDAALKLLAVADKHPEALLDSV
jgi:putative transcriptional regulator